MEEKKRICIAEDHTILREGLRVLLSQDPEFEVVCEVHDGLELIRRCRDGIADLILLDLSMPRLGGLEAILEIKKRVSQQLKILVLTVHDVEEYILAALRSGADGYVLKDATHAELRIAIRSVLMGKIYLSPSISGKIIKAYLQIKSTEEPRSTWGSLTHRERELLKLIGEGHKNKEIAQYLHLSVKTVETHRANLMKKLDLHSAAALTAYAIEKGLVLR
ncbi:MULTISPECIES: response regulator [Methylocaldum]|jgi:DNA-binding NarL/FixJ family response regulator|uniref:response regulator n=1 Tax=unclassified Methylocaldum TaxID=2622260 RepID=UPI000A31E736|nr:response regulator transcription factor [Methylocaldum sp. RMAD-M]MBP1152237.1 DNA-binding NarL/FixJ family response regulator [Methylocaldum sp. RMAD-M]MDV3240947.1 response regulator transcription factor [Methylocaldum sp.]MVF24830.1 response regulator transcription factor [Methylocaldum sp. BRCS4]